MGTKSGSKAIYLDKGLLRSKNFRTLSKWSMLVYLDVLRKRRMVKNKKSGRDTIWSIGNNGDIIYPYSEAEHKGIGRREFRNSIDELVERGFLDVTHWGSGGRSGDVTKYFLDDRWKDYGNKKKFLLAKKPRVKQSLAGRGWKIYNEKKRPSVTNMSPKKPLSSVKNVTPNRKNKRLSIDKNVTRKKGDRIPNASN